MFLISESAVTFFRFREPFSLYEVELECCILHLRNLHTFLSEGIVFRKNTAGKNLKIFYGINNSFQKSKILR